ncbi:carbohydrate sulfotransferase 1 isoform X1 [Patella vulgata]|uniref:carbohydrate sulfotransferase 1 isoform X1 n=2 Tax=Patella vulgata TaxID=6465 RepID=UPI0024A8B600|nr:carbohydrate sulfotransferase 1 isoform X1 [Patella vulgata]XP_055957172.1 carbohydrate sulfotransferase 1 isoform X1 [Patella vulgata]
MISRKLMRWLFYLTIGVMVWIITTKTADFRIPRDLPERKSNVILLTYMRSGSSLVGDIIQQSPDVFYVFEPLIMLGRYHKLNTSAIPLIFLNSSSIRKIKDKKSFHQLSEKTIQSFLSCDFEEIDISTLRTGYYSKSLSTKLYNRCLQTNHGVFGLILCLIDLQKRCYASKTTLAKVIRLPMQTVSEMMANNSNLKIIHLVRDPRAVFVSQVNMKKYKLTDVFKFTETFCDRLIDDLYVTLDIARRYPGRIHLLSYEQLCDNPVKISKTLYNFLDLHFTSKVKQYVNNITSSGNEDGAKCAVCTSRANSSLTSQKWRYSISFEGAKQLEENCKIVFDILGYKSLEAKGQLVDQNIKSFQNTEIYDLV